MPIQIHIPGSLRRFADGSAQISVEAASVADALGALSARFPRLGGQLLAADGKVRGFVNVFVNSRDIRHLDSERTVLASGDVIALMPAIAGG